MFNIKFYKKSFFFIFLFFISFNTIAQSGIFFQAIARDNNTNPAKDRRIYIQSSIIQYSPIGTKVLTEVHQTNTDAFGIFSIIVGNGLRVGGSDKGLSSIDWSNGPYYLNLKIAITPISVGAGWDYSKEWVDIGTTIFGTVPFALYSASTAGIDKKLNVSDTAKMLSQYAKTSYTDSVFLTKLNAADTIHFTKQLYTDALLSRKMNIDDTIKFTKQLYTDSVLQTKMNLFDTSRFTNITYTDSALLTKLNSTGSAASLTNFPTLNQNTTGNAATATYANSANVAITAITAGNITATSNSTLTLLPSLSTVATITSGIWSATTIDIAHGGTGLSTAGSSGQILTSTESGTLTWTNFTTLTGAHYLGESFGGGIVFYVYDNGKHGLIIAAEDQSTGINASTFTSSNCCTTTNAFRDGVNAGMSNTERIILTQGSGNYAASLAANYKGGGFGDWYLPSIAELKLIILNKKYIMSTFLNPLDQFKMYWSSNENPTNNQQMWNNYLTIDLGKFTTKYANTSTRVRAIRAF
jgi:hypothetical protein